MKLLFCPSCKDLFKLQTGEIRECACGKAFGMYVDEINALVNGGIPVAIDNYTFSRAFETIGRLREDYFTYVKDMNTEADILPIRALQYSTAFRFDGSFVIDPGDTMRYASRKEMEESLKQQEHETAEKLIERLEAMKLGEEDGESAPS